MKLTRLLAAAALVLVGACKDTTGSTGPDLTSIGPPPALPAGATTVTTGTGLQYVVITPGTGAGPVTSGQTVSVEYTGWLQATQAAFDTNVGGNPFVFTTGQGVVIPGFEQGIVGMKVGEKRRIIVPPNLGYGGNTVTDSKGRVVIPANSTLIFDIRLIGVQ